MTDELQYPLEPVSAHDPFGTGFKHRACRLLVKCGESIYKACWMVLERDGSVSIGLSTPAMVITELGTARVDPAGKVSAQPDLSTENIPLSARTGPHVTLHRSGVCHVRARRETPLVQTMYGDWHPPIAEFEWLQLFTSPIGIMPKGPANLIGRRDAVVPFPSADQSLVIRVDLLPRDKAGRYQLLDGALHTAVGLAPEYAVRLSTFQHTPVQPMLLIRVGRTESSTVPGRVAKSIIGTIAG
jgi:hypothetical protein